MGTVKSRAEGNRFANLFTSRAFWISMSPTFIIIAKAFGLEVDSATVTAILTSAGGILAYLLINDKLESDERRELTKAKQS